MSAVEDWARRKAMNPHQPTPNPEYQGGFVSGATALADALLSDEALAAAARVSAPDDWDSGDLSTDEREWLKTEARAALQAAVRAVTDPKTHDSSTATTGEQ